MFTPEPFVQRVNVILSATACPPYVQGKPLLALLTPGGGSHSVISLLYFCPAVMLLQGNEMRCPTLIIDPKMTERKRRPEAVVTRGGRGKGGAVKRTTDELLTAMLAYGTVSPKCMDSGRSPRVPYGKRPSSSAQLRWG